MTYHQGSWPPFRVWQESATAGPHQYYEMRPAMPRIPDNHLQTVAFLYPTEADARAGQKVGGSGLVISVASGVADWRIRYIVTNAHVIEPAGAWVRLNYPGPERFWFGYIPFAAWINNGVDDVAIALLALPPHVTPYENWVPETSVTRDFAHEFRVGPGDDIYMVGRYVGHGGRLTNNPIARFGVIALMPSEEDLVRDHRGKDVEAYLVEMRSQPGFSGSPVYLRIPQWSFRGISGDTSLEDNTERFRLLGIDTGFKQHMLPVKQLDQEGNWLKTNLHAEHMSDISIVCPIWKVADLLNREDLDRQRREIGRELERLRGQEGAAPASAERDDPSFTREDFLKSLDRATRLTEPDESRPEG